MVSYGISRLNWVCKCKSGLRNSCKPRIHDFAGFLEAYEAGARGVVATPTSCGAALFRKMYDEFFVTKDYESAKNTFDSIILLDNAIAEGFCASAKYLCSLQGVPMGWTTRGNHNLSPARLKSLRVYHDYAKANGLL